MRITPAMTHALKKLDACGHLSRKLLRQHQIAQGTVDALMRRQLVKTTHHTLFNVRYDLTDEGRELLK